MGVCVRARLWSMCACTSEVGVGFGYEGGCVGGVGVCMHACVCVCVWVGVGVHVHVHA